MDGCQDEATGSPGSRHVNVPRSGGIGAGRASPRNRADSGAAAGPLRNLRTHRPITARMTTLLSVPDPSHDVYAALWLGSLLIASGAATPDHLEALTRRYFALYPPEVKA